MVFQHIFQKGCAKAWEIFFPTVWSLVGEMMDLCGRFYGDTTSPHHLSLVKLPKHPMSRAEPPIQEEEDLSKLYYDVLAGFTTEGEGTESLSNSLGTGGFAGTPGESNILSIYDSYHVEPGRVVQEAYRSSRPSQNGAQHRVPGESRHGRVVRSYHLTIYDSGKWEPSSTYLESFGRVTIVPKAFAQTSPQASIWTDYTNWGRCGTVYIQNARSPSFLS